MSTLLKILVKLSIIGNMFVSALAMYRGDTEQAVYFILFAILGQLFVLEHREA